MPFLVVVWKVCLYDNIIFLVSVDAILSFAVPEAGYIFIRMLDSELFSKELKVTKRTFSCITCLRKCFENNCCIELIVISLLHLIFVFISVKLRTKKIKFVIIIEKIFFVLHTDILLFFIKCVFFLFFIAHNKITPTIFYYIRGVISEKDTIKSSDIEYGKNCVI